MTPTEGRDRRLETCRAAREEGVVIVGAGQAGGRCAEALRANGFAGRVTVIGDEQHPPYERPSLSKEGLLRAGSAVAWIRSVEAFALDDVDLRLGLRVAGLDRARRTVRTSEGEELPYGVLVLATGARARRLDVPEAASSGVHVLRTIGDSERLQVRLNAGARVLVIGGGFIGLEVAAAARERRAEVTLLEAAPRLMMRAVPPEVSDIYAAMHSDQDVRLRLGTSVVRVETSGSALTIVSDRDERFDADLLVVGIGIVPNDELAAEAGLAADRGIVVDEFGMTSDPHVFAAGDVARHYNPLLARHILLESWQNAQNQAIAVARVISGVGEPYAEIPWFWTEQYGRNLQMTGLLADDALTVRRDGAKPGSWVLFQLAANRLVSAYGLDAARDIRAAKELIALRTPVTAEELANPAVKLAELVRRTTHLPVAV